MDTAVLPGLPRYPTGIKANQEIRSEFVGPGKLPEGSCLKVQEENLKSRSMEQMVGVTEEGKEEEGLGNQSEEGSGMAEEKKRVNKVWRI